ncbi:MAG TPA: 3D domain-containing protein [Bacillota bacterium]|nr:3D domain-containing protein [Bacillota bacterium]
MNLSKTDNKDTQKFLIALLIYIVAIIFIDIMIADKTFAPAHQNNEKQGQNHQLQGEQLRGEQQAQVQGEQQAQGQGEQVPIPVYHRPDSKQDSEPSRGETVKCQEMVVQATSYSHTGQKTYSGTWPREGVTIAVDNKKIKIGSKVYIYELNNWYLAEDKIPASSVRKGAIIDIFRNDEKSCWAWGRRDVRVRVVSPESSKNKNN